MPIAVDLPPTWEVPAQEVRSSYKLEGSDGQILAKQFGSVIAHWNSRPSYVIDCLASPNDEITHVPFKKIGTIKVHFKPARPMRPRSIEIEDDEEE